MPYKVLDAPNLQDDFYLNLVDWSASNVLAVGLNRAVYIWSACTSQVKKLCELPVDNSITSVGWSNRGQHLAIGTDSGDTQIWDTNHCKMIRSEGGHLGRVSAISWNGSTISTGSRDRTIMSRDMRARNSLTHVHTGHKQEVCGLKWSFDGQ
jgi:cell division cycle 20-like protein 1 (cofactor of APC complex)|tara:strand:+ start:1528 stop:1983 length:456 start_codon:yes stop_codon:yes gene_type:complete